MSVKINSKDGKLIATKTMVEVYDDVPRVGTWAIAKGFDRPHYDILKLIYKHKERFWRLENNSRNKSRCFVTRRISSKQVGRPVDEVMLNISQIILLVGLLRNTDATIRLLVDIIKAGRVAEVLNLLNSIDVDDIDVRYVYVMEDSDGNLKIGISNNPERRLTEIQAANAKPVRIVAVKECKKRKYQDEVELHNKCEEHRIHGEWYRASALEELDVESCCIN